MADGAGVGPLDGRVATGETGETYVGVERGTHPANKIIKPIKRENRILSAEKYRYLRL
jgi:hypothetical protein